MNGMLSQEEINALLKENDVQNEASAANQEISADLLSSMEKASIDKVNATCAPSLCCIKSDKSKVAISSYKFNKSLSCYHLNNLKQCF